MSQVYRLFGGTPPHEASSETSRAAAESIRPHVTRLAAQVLGVIVDSMPKGITCDAIEERLDMRHTTCSARVRELALKGIIEARGTRKVRSGRSANVWVLRGKGAP